MNQSKFINQSINHLINCNSNNNNNKNIILINNNNNNNENIYFNAFNVYAFASFCFE